eukprot:2101132-Ditylum_brightwellii.AAC.1
MQHFPFKSTQIKFIWRLARKAVVDPSVQVDFNTKKKGNSGQKPKYSKESLLTSIQQTPLPKHSTLCSLLNTISILRSTLGRMQKKGWFQQHSNAVKPFLTDVNKISRLKFATSF